MAKINIKDKLAREVYYSNYGARINVALFDKFKISRVKSAQFRELINDLLLKKIKIVDFDKELVEKLKLSPTKAKKIAIEIVGRKFLILDDYFEKAGSKYLQSLGANPADYAESVDEFKKQLAEEEKMLVEEEEKELVTPFEKKQQEVPNIELRDPEKEVKDIGSIFDNQIIELLKFVDFRAKADLNMLIILLFLEKEEFIRTLQQKLINSSEKVTAENIEVSGQQVEPTIGNWLKDLISVVGIEGAVSSIDKARYMAESKNASKLNKEEANLLDMVFDLYVAIRNFTTDAQRKNLGDISIFPFTEKDAAAMEEFAKERMAAEKKTASAAAPPKDIFELYMGSKEDQAKIEAMKKSLEKKTEGNSENLAEELEDGFLKKDKFKTIGALMLLVEKGAFIKLLIEDIKYRDYLTSYLNRIGKAGLVDNFVINPTEPRFVVFLIRYILEERLELSEEEAARIATRFDTIYTKKGMEKYSQLAFYDMSDGKFKWS